MLRKRNTSTLDSSFNLSILTDIGLNNTERPYKRRSLLNESLQKNHHPQKGKEVAKMCYIPTMKNPSFDNTSQILQKQSFQRFNQTWNKSLSISRQNSQQKVALQMNVNQSKRFKRKTEKFMNKTIIQGQRQTQENTQRAKRSNPNILELLQVCQKEECAYQNNLLRKSNESLKQKNQTLKQEIQKQEIKYNDISKKYQLLQYEIREKGLTIDGLNNIITKKEENLKKTYDNLNAKNKQLIKMQQIVQKLQKKIQNTNDPQSFTPFSFESSQVINKLNHQIKYYEFQTHVLKKEKHNIKQFQYKLKNVYKENMILKQRIREFVKQKNKKYIDDSDSQKSLTLSLSSTSPAKSFRAKHI